MSTFRNRLLKAVLDGSQFRFVSIPESTAGDICVYDKLNDSILIVSGKFKSSDFPLDYYTPIGIVVIPGLHEIYGGNTCGVISLTEMSCDNPEIGEINAIKSMCFSPQIELNLKNFNVVIIKDDDTLKTNGFGYLSKNGKYNSSTLKIPDPYNSDLNRNPDYYNTSVSAYNAMSNFTGRDNTNILLNHRGPKNYNSWKPIYNTANNYPAASCCDMYFTEGTTQGQWYLPAAGEWGYITSKWDIIQKSISLLNKNYGDISMPLADNESYWTSSEHNSKNTRYVHTDNGMGHIAKTTSTLRVRSLFILKEDLQFPIYLYTTQLEGDFYRRNSDNLALDIIDWYNKVAIPNSSGGSYVPNSILSGKLYVDNYEVTSLELENASREYLIFETSNTYDELYPLKVIQYKSSNGVIKGTIDIM